MTNIPKKGDRYRFYNLDVEVLRVSKTGAWADIAVQGVSTHWTKRQPLPFPDTFRPLGGDDG